MDRGQRLEALAHYCDKLLDAVRLARRDRKKSVGHREGISDPMAHLGKKELLPFCSLALQGNIPCDLRRADDVAIDTAHRGNGERDRYEPSVLALPDCL